MRRLPPASTTYPHTHLQEGVVLRLLLAPVIVLFLVLTGFMNGYLDYLLFFFIVLFVFQSRCSVTRQSATVTKI